MDQHSLIDKWNRMSGAQRFLTFIVVVTPFVVAVLGASGFLEKVGLIFGVKPVQVTMVCPANYKCIADPIIVVSETPQITGNNNAVLPTGASAPQATQQPAATPTLVPVTLVPAIVAWSMKATEAIQATAKPEPTVDESTFWPLNAEQASSYFGGDVMRWNEVSNDMLGKGWVYSLSDKPTAIINPHGKSMYGEYPTNDGLRYRYVTKSVFAAQHATIWQNADLKRVWCFTSAQKGWVKVYPLGFSAPEKSSCPKEDNLPEFGTETPKPAAQDPQPTPTVAVADEVVNATAMSSEILMFRNEQFTWGPTPIIYGGSDYNFGATRWNGNVAQVEVKVQSKKQFDRVHDAICYDSPDDSTFNIGLTDVQNKYGAWGFCRQSGRAPGSVEASIIMTVPGKFAVFGNCKMFQNKGAEGLVELKSDESNNSIYTIKAIDGSGKDLNSDKIIDEAYVLIKCYSNGDPNYIADFTAIRLE